MFDEIADEASYRSQEGIMYKLREQSSSNQALNGNYDSEWAFKSLYTLLNLDILFCFFRLECPV